MNIRFLRETAVCAIAASLVVACHGLETLAGISGTGITSSGTVTAVGSVSVNGVEFTTDNANIIVDGESATEADLRVGQVVTVTGTLETETRGVAETVVFNRLLDGPIETFDPTDGTITALGRTVRIDGATEFDEFDFSDLEPEELQENNLILVSGFTDDNGDVVATYLRRGAVVFEFDKRIDVEAKVRDLNPASATFSVGTGRGALPVSYLGIDVNETAGALREGVAVEIFGTLSEQTGVFTADSVTVLDPILGEPGERVELEGIIANFNGRGDFTISGQPVNASAAVREGGSGLALGTGLRAEVEGVINDDGVLVAEAFSVR